MSNTLIKEGEDRFEEYPNIQTSHVPDFTQILTNRMASAVQPNLPGFDPHNMMVKKKQIEKGEIPAEPTISTPKWPEKDVQALEDFCKQYGIIGFNTGRMPPLSALAQLKKMMGMDYTNVPLESRTPMGYQKIGTPHNNLSPNYPYQLPADKRSILSG